MSVLNITQITFTQFRFFFFLPELKTIVTGRKTDRCTDRKSLQGYVFSRRNLLLKGLVQQPPLLSLLLAMLTAPSGQQISCRHPPPL